MAKATALSPAKNQNRNSKHPKPGLTTALRKTVMHFYSGKRCKFTPALTFAKRSILGTGLTGQGELNYPMNGVGTGVRKAKRSTEAPLVSHSLFKGSGHSEERRMVYQYRMK